MSEKINLKQKIFVACTNANGEADMFVCEVESTQEEITNGKHYEKAKSLALENGYEGNFVCFDANEQSNIARQVTELECLVPSTQSLEFAIQLEGGLIQNIFCKDSKNIDCTFAVFDYDTEGLGEDELSYITQPGGEAAKAYISHQGLSDSPVINLDEILNG